MEAHTPLPRDPLTGLYNLKYAKEKLMLEEKQRGRARSPYCVLLADVDRLEEFNDLWGQHAGDHALVVLADRMRGQCRKSDLTARTGGDEFLICLPDTPTDVAAKMAERIRRSVETISLPERVARVTVSVGLTRWRPQESALEALRRADDLLYQAKNAGRNQVRVG